MWFALYLDALPGGRYTDTKLSDEHQHKVGEAVTEAGALALAGLTPEDAVTVRLGANRWWRGYPPADILGPLQRAAAEKADE